MMVGPLSAPSSRSVSPATTTASDHHANTTIDDLTRECPSLAPWSDVRAKLESSLVLSAEVGSGFATDDAVLSHQESEASFSETSDLPDDARLHIELLKRKLDIVTEENSIMESEIQELLIKIELSDSMTKTLQCELHDARTTAHHLSAQQTRSAVQERDDMRQERDASLVAVRNTEIKVRSDTEKACEVRDELEEARRNELEEVDHDETKVNFTIGGLEDDLKEDAPGLASQSNDKQEPDNTNTHTNTHHAFALPYPGPSSLGINSLSSHSETSSLSGPEHTRPSTATLTLSTSKLDMGFAPAPTPATTNWHLLPTDPHPITAMTSTLAPLLTGLTQGDPRTLRVQLKRQNLNADAWHVGRGTIQVATREAMKALLRLVRDLFSTVGALREQLNEVLFELEVAGQMRKEAFHGNEGGSWMPAISRLLFKQPTSLSNPTTSSSSTHAAAPHASANAITLRDHISLPLLLHPQSCAAAQVSASPMTVNVLARSTFIHGFVSTDDIVRTTSLKAIQSLPPHTAADGAGAAPWAVCQCSGFGCGRGRAGQGKGRGG
ncbi:hypothetical protein BU17DRAFT_96998 [Hysterangium stoloniferum]|nr:hypothetical protein BU17DRAFT_96998 [Hysterangium stoloniferum]